MPPPPRIRRSRSTTSGRTSSRERSRTATVRSTLWRVAVSLALRENTVISHGTDARSWVTIDWRIASSPRFRPPYDPEMPIRYGRPSCSSRRAVLEVMGRTGLQLLCHRIPLAARAESARGVADSLPVFRAPVRTSRSEGEGFSGGARAPAPVRPGATGTALAAVSLHEVVGSTRSHEHATLAGGGGGAGRAAGGGGGGRALLHRRAAPPLHRGEDERLPRGLHRPHREAPLRPDQLLHGPAQRGDRPERAPGPAGGQFRAHLRERPLEGAAARPRGGRHPARAPRGGPEPDPGSQRDRRSHPGEGQGVAERPAGDLPAQDQPAADHPGRR